MSDLNPELLIVENAMSQFDFEMCKKEIEDNRDKLTIVSVDYGKESNFSYKRWYPAPRTVIPNLADNMLFNTKIKNLIEDYQDGFWRLFLDDLALGYEVQVTSYKKSRNNRYEWHVDHQIGDVNGIKGFRILNYIFYVNDVEEGGELEISGTKSFAPDEDLNLLKSIFSYKPKANTLVVVPSWYLHRVKPILGEEERLTVNGHIYMENTDVILGRLKK